MENKGGNNIFDLTLFIMIIITKLIIFLIMGRITVATPSKIKFFENRLGFLERPTNTYCGKSELLITHNSGKTRAKYISNDNGYTCQFVGEILKEM